MSIYMNISTHFFSLLYRVSLPGFFYVMSGDYNRSSVVNTLPNQMIPNAVYDIEFVLATEAKVWKLYYLLS